MDDMVQVVVVRALPVTAQVHLERLQLQQEQVEPVSHQQLLELHETMQAVAVVVQAVPVVPVAVEQVDFLMELLQLPEVLTLVAVAVAEREQAVRMRSWEPLADPESSSFVTQLRRQIPLHQQSAGAPLMGRR
jgi:hypothetical protein